jgi:hypothetical protein
MAQVVDSTLDQVIFQLEVALRGASVSPEPRLIVNAGSLVVEYNALENNSKHFDKIATLVDK